MSPIPSWIKRIHQLGCLLLGLHFLGHPLGLRNYQNYNWTCFEDLKDHRLTEPEAAASEASEAKDVATAEPLTEAAVATAGA